MEHFLIYNKEEEFGEEETRKRVPRRERGNEESVRERNEYHRGFD